MTSSLPCLPALHAALRQLLGSRVSNVAAVRDQHARGESHHGPLAPDLVAWPATTEEVSEIVRQCAHFGVPMVPFGAGTSLEGHVLAPLGGVSVDLSRMTRILAVNEHDFDAVVEAGVTRQQLNRRLRDTGLMFPIDPGADATLGGMAATRASGTTAVRYGTMRDNVLALTVVLADGQVVRTGSRARKSSAGYDLTRLFVGSEGTLGIITELTLRLHPQPESVAAAVCSFQSLREAVAVVIETLQVGVQAARIELLDARQIDAVNRYSHTAWPVLPTLFFEFHGSSAAQLAEDARSVEALVTERDAAVFEWVTTPEERTRLWKARHDAFYAALALRPNGRALITDVCVPISRLADCILETQQETERSSVPSTLVGHVGDGNFHVIFVLDPDRPEELAEAQQLSEQMVRRALAMGGTCTGEHGVGVGKLPYMELEHGDALHVMRAVKAALDPRGLMNPGKVLSPG